MFFQYRFYGEQIVKACIENGCHHVDISGEPQVCLYSKSGHSKIDTTKVLKTNGSLMKVKSIIECSLGAFCNTFDLH